MTPDQYFYEQGVKLLQMQDAIEADLMHRKTSLITLLMHRASQEAAQAMLALVNADPTDAETIRKHQSTIQRQQDLAGWINDTWQRANDFAATMTAADADTYGNLAGTDPDHIEDGVED